MSSDRTPSPQEQARGVGHAVTNLTKLGGLVLVCYEVLIRPELRPGVLAVTAFMMAGAHGLETLLDRLLGK